MAWTPGDKSGSQVLTPEDHLYESHINELRSASDLISATVAEQSDDLESFVGALEQHTLDLATKVVIAGDLAGTPGSPIVKSRTVTATVGRSGCDYNLSSYANARLMINAALLAVSNAGGGIVALRAFFTAAEMGTGSIAYKSNVWLTGEGWSTGLQLAGGGGRTLNIQDCTNVRISDIRIDGSQLTTVDGAIIVARSGNVSLSNVWVLDTPGPGIKVTSNTTDTTKVTLDRCTITTGGAGDAIFGGQGDAISSTGEVIVTRCFVRQGQLYDPLNPVFSYSASAMNLVAMKRNIVTNNIFEGSLVMGGEKIPHYHSTFADNVVRPPGNSNVATISLLMDSNAGQTDISTYLNFTGNQIEKGLILIHGQSSASSADNIIIANNNIEAVDKTGAPVDTGIKLEQLKNVNLLGNIVNGANVGISYYDVHGMIIDGNQVRKCTTPLLAFSGAGESSGVLIGFNPGMFGDNGVALKAGNSRIDTNQPGANFDIYAGAGTGTGSGGSFNVWVPTSGSSGIIRQSLVKRLTLTTSANGRLILGNNTDGTPSVDGISMKGDVDRIVQTARNPTANQAGKYYKSLGGDAANQGTNLNGGQNIIAPGLSTGSGVGDTVIQSVPGTTNPLDAIASITLNTPGAGYTAGDVLGIAGGTGGQATVNTVALDGRIRTSALNNGGVGYTAGDVLTVSTGGGTGATVTVSTVTLSGTILTYSLSAPGTAYVNTTGAILTGGTGTGALLNITAVYSAGGIITISLTTPGTGYTLATGAAVTGGTGTGALLNVVPWANTYNAAVTRMTFKGNGATGLGTTTPNDASVLDLGANAGALFIPRYTTAQKTALNAVNGMVVYDTTLNKFQGYEGGAWVSLV